MIQKIKTALILSVVVAMFGTVLLVPGYASEPKKGGNLVFMASPLFGLDIHKELTHASVQCLGNIYNSLLTYDAKGNIITDLAKSWEMSSDEKVYTFKLHDNVYFHNGRKLIAADVQYSIYRIMDPKNGSPRMDTLWAIEKIETPDDLTVKFTLKKPFAPFLAYVANPWAAIVAKENVEDGSILKHPVGTGPFKFKEMVSGSYVLMEKNTKYFKPGLPYLDTVKQQMESGVSPVVAALRSKKCDLTNRSGGGIVNNVKRIKNLKTYKAPPLQYASMFFNNTKPPFDNPKVRLAISYAIDRQEVIDAGMMGVGNLTAPVPEGLLGNFAMPVNKLAGYKHNYEKGKALLKEAGFENGLTMKLMTTSDFSDYLTICQIIQDQLKNIGIKVEIVSMEWGAFIGSIFQTEGYDAFFIEIAPLALDPDIYLYRLFHSTGIWNARKFSDPVVDKLLDEGRLVSEPGKRKQIYHDLQTRMADIGAAVWLFRTDLNWTIQPWVKGTVINPMVAKFETTWLDK